MFLRGTCIVCSNLIMCDSEGYLVDMDNNKLSEDRCFVYEKNIICNKCVRVFRELIREEIEDVRTDIVV